MELPEQLPAHIQGLVRERVVRHWPLVRAFECRTARCSAQGLLEPGEWAIFTSDDAGRSKAGIVQQVGASRRFHLQSEYWGPPEFITISVYERVPCKDYFVKWSGSEVTYVRKEALLAVGVSMERMEALPLEWPRELRHPNGRRRCGPAYVMPAHVRMELLPYVGEIVDMLPNASEA